MFFVLVHPATASASQLSRDDIERGESAFAAAKARDWSRMRLIGDEIENPTLRKLITWVDLIRSSADLPFEDRASFVLENPDWPWQRTLRRLAEESMSADMQPATVMSWFGRFEPLTNQGHRMLGSALLAAGDLSRSQEVIRNAWIEGDFSATEERAFVHQFGQMLTKDTHARRLDRLLWNGELDQARRMLPRVGFDDGLVAEARMKLRQMAPDVDAAIANVPETRRSDPGLVYERLRWQRRKEKNEQARETLRRYALDQVRPELWWRERAILSRRALEEGYVSEAYHTAKDHALSEGAQFAEAEWLSGWLALRFLGEPKQAARHFERMYSNVNYPISRARGAYWSGRAADEAGDRSLATHWYKTAAQHPTTFYGQLATVQTEGAHKLRLPPNPIPNHEEITAFENHELVQAVRILGRYGQSNRLRPFVLRVGELSDSPGWKAQAAALASAHGQDDLAIAIAKQAAQIGHPPTNDGYPLIAIPNLPSPLPHAVETPLVLAMVRQESAFRANAVSPAGARGLMQLLPGTARQVARKINVSYSRPRLTSDPSYNLTLGQAYMSEMLQRFGGSYILALAAYNAGPERVAEWTRARGQPRDGVSPAIDWIEEIPFAETRNYVQRVLESLQVYRTRLDKSAASVTIEDDLKR